MAAIVSLPSSAWLEASSRRIAAVWASSVASVDVALLLLAPARAAPVRLALASAMLWVAAFPLLELYLGRGKRAPVMPVLAALHFMYFGLPVFTDKVFHRGQPYDGPEVTTAVALTLGGLGAMQLMFFSPLGAVAELPRARLDFDLRRSARWLLAFAVPLALASAVSFSYEFPVATRGTVAHLRHIGVLLLCGLELSWLRGQLSRAATALGALASAA